MNFGKINFGFVNNKKNKDGKSILPQRATEGSIGYDFISPITVTILPGESQMIWTDINAKFPKKYALLIDVRSSMSKRRLMLSNILGIVDSDYINADNEGNIGINLYNYGSTPQIIEAGERIAQGIFVKCAIGSDRPTAKRTGGFGSTNK